MNTDSISNDARATIKNLRSFYGKFPQVVRIEKGLERLMDFRCVDEEPECLAVIGETGTGKSTILNRFACRYPRVTHAEFTEVPVLLVPVPAKCTIKLLSAEALSVMGSPFAAKGNEVELTTQLLTLLAACGTRMIIFDEVNHLSDRGGQKSHYLVGDWIKSLSYKSKLPIVLVGTPAAQVLWRTNEQLGDRFHEAIHLRALTHVKVPLYLYDDSDGEQAGSAPQDTLFSHEVVAPTSRKRKDAITAEGLAHFQSTYPGENISRGDLFYYVYGLLHSPDYRERFADNLGKELPRIPCVKTAADFWAFCRAGRKLAELHLNYESVEPYPLRIDSGGKKLTDADYRVEKMRYGKGKGKDKDLTTLHYNDRITVTGIPLEAYDYVVNGKPALDWVVERQGVKTDKDSGIVNNANDWAVETMGNPRYPLELFQRVVTVSLETMRIVRELPALVL